MADGASSARSDLLLIGTIVMPFGVKGQVKVSSFTNKPDHLRRVKTVFVGLKQLPIPLRRVIQHKPDVLVLTLGGIEDRNAAEALRGSEIFIREEDAAPLEVDEYFLHDLPGLRVETTAGALVGEVKDVLETGANEVLVVKRVEGGEALIPMIHDIVKALDLAAKRIVIEPMAGLLDE